MNNPSNNRDLEPLKNPKILGIIVGSAGLGALFTYGSAELFGYSVEPFAVLLSS